MRRHIALPLFFILATGCHSWRMASVTPVEAVRRAGGHTIRVLTSHDTTRVSFAYVANDSLLGQVAGGKGRNQRYAAALPDVQQIQVRHLDVVRTLLAVTAVGGAIAVVAAAAAEPKSAPPPTTFPGCSGSGGCYISCPLVYSWDGHRYRLDSGTFGGAVVRALQRTDLDNLDYARPDAGLIRLRVANEQSETDHLDAITVLAVDHAADVVVAPDAAGRIHAFHTPAGPIGAVDFRGRDVLSRVSGLDGRFWLSDPTNRDSARVADVRDGVELSFIRPAGAEQAHLVVDANDTQWATMLVEQWIAAHGPGTEAWYDSLNADPAKARSDAAPLVREGFLTAKLWDGTHWMAVGQFWEAGPEVLKRQVLELDLRKITGDTIRVRLESAPSLWRIDHVAMAFGNDAPMTSRELPLASARTLEGVDVGALLRAQDDRYLTLETGHAAELAYEAPAAAAEARTFLLRSTGWYHMNLPSDSVADVAMLGRLAREPLALSRIAVGRLNDALAELRSEAGQ